ncbi:hypothetical protein Tco_0474831 [Tanacetum coccineum]
MTGGHSLTVAVVHILFRPEFDGPSGFTPINLICQQLMAFHPSDIVERRCSYEGFYKVECWSFLNQLCKLLLSCSYAEPFDDKAIYHTFPLKLVLTQELYTLSRGICQLFSGSGNHSREWVHSGSGVPGLSAFWNQLKLIVVTPVNVSIVSVLPFPKSSLLLCFGMSF